MRSLIYLFAILTGLAVPHATEARVAAPIAVDAAQMFAATERQDQAAPASLFANVSAAFVRHMAAAIALDGDNPTSLYNVPVYLSDRARE